MKHIKGRVGPALLILLGASLVLFGLIGLWRAPDRLQYVIEAPQEQAAESESGEDAEDPQALKALIQKKIDALDAMTDCLSASALSTLKQGAEIASGGESRTAAVSAVTEGYFEVWPAYLTKGRYITPEELTDGSPLIMLGDNLAFQLFGAEDPLDQTVLAEGGEYRVVGVYRDAQPVTRQDEMSAIVPLRAADAALRGSAVTLSAAPIANSGAFTLFREAAAARWQAGGDLYSLKKEAMRRTIIVRLPLFVLGLWLALRILRGLNRLTNRRVQRFRAELAERYLISLLPRLALLILTEALLYAALAGALYALMAFGIAPLYTFTEWVPDNIVEYSSLKAVFRSLVDAFSKLSTLSTPEMETLNFYGGFTRWGMITLLLGWILFLMDGRLRKREQSAPNR